MPTQPLPTACIFSNSDILISVTSIQSLSLPCVSAALHGFHNGSHLAQWHRLHAFSVNWLHLWAHEYHLLQFFQPLGSRYPPANCIPVRQQFSSCKPRHSLSWSSCTDTPLLAFSWIYTNPERGEDSSKQDLRSVIYRARAPLGRWEEDCSSQGFISWDWCAVSWWGVKFSSESLCWSFVGSVALIFLLVPTVWPDKQVPLQCGELLDE